MIYIASDWYWSDSKGAIYGSARNGLVSSPKTDAAYQAFLRAGGAATPMPKDDFGARNATVLDAELARIGQPLTGLVPPTPAMLFSYANSKVKALLAAPRPYSPSNGITVTNDATTQTAADLTGLLVGPSAMGSSDTTQWTDDTGVVAMLTQAQVSALAVAIVGYAKSVYAVLATAASQISTTAITTTAQIDALTWPI